MQHNYKGRVLLPTPDPLSRSLWGVPRSLHFLPALAHSPVHHPAWTITVCIRFGLSALKWHLCLPIPEWSRGGQQVLPMSARWRRTGPPALMQSSPRRFTVVTAGPCYPGQCARWTGGRPRPQGALGSRLREGGGGGLGWQRSVVLRAQASEPGLAIVPRVFCIDHTAPLCKALQETATGSGEAPLGLLPAAFGA